ncbi:MAG TPA: glycosyltransferase family 2 protein [Candidatus Omnitrophota bacterium]|nr:glycosyltransferase family 2 protein [Candidatus Omnitrophota bacterium]
MTQSDKMMPEKILIIVPALNESGNIQKIVEEILALPIPLVVVVVDDGSGDATACEAKKTSARVISLPFNLGIGGAVQTGFKYALDKEFTLAVQVDGDGQHDVGYLQKLIEPVLKGQADMTIGSRFLSPYLGYRSSLVRRVGIHFFSHLISLLTGSKVTDPTSGFRAFNRRMIEAFARSYPHDFPEPEAIMIARRLNAVIVEVPVKMRKRAYGSSSIRYLKTLYYMVKVTFAILLNMVKKKNRCSS